jgi:hypothetical protein
VSVLGLQDDGMYVIGIFDMEPAGLLIRAYNQSTSTQYSLSPTETEVAAAGLNRSPDSLRALANSIDIYEIGSETFIHSQLPGISKPKVLFTCKQPARSCTPALYIGYLKSRASLNKDLLALNPSSVLVIEV